jgi:hypothetical protein
MTNVQHIHAQKILRVVVRNIVYLQKGESVRISDFMSPEQRMFPEQRIVLANNACSLVSRKINS